MTLNVHTFDVGHKHIKYLYIFISEAFHTIY